MQSNREIINSYGRKELAEDLQVPPERVRGWERLDTIPKRYWQRLLEVAPNRGIEISPDLLIRIAARN